MKRIDTKILPISMISVAAIGVAFVSGMALTSHQTTNQPIHLFKTTSSTAQTAISAPATSADQPQPAPDSTLIPVSTSTPQQRTQTTSPVDSSTQTAIATTQQSTQNNNPSSTPPPAVTATSAAPSGWSDPVAADSTYPKGTTVQYTYCVWTYSDGTTQQAVLNTKHNYPPVSGGQFNMQGSDVSNSGISCDVASAPPAG